MVKCAVVLLSLATGEVEEKEGIFISCESASYYMVEKVLPENYQVLSMEYIEYEL